MTLILNEIAPVKVEMKTMYEKKNYNKIYFC